MLLKTANNDQKVLIIQELSKKKKIRFLDQKTQET